jgi:hypothetical protein
MSLPSYIVYVDESFFQFWGLKRPLDNFCYLAFGLPTHHLKAFEIEHKLMLADFQRAARTDLASKALDPKATAEIKSTLFRQFDIVNRRRLALRLRGLMLASECFVLAEFSEVQGFILEAVRSDLLEAGKKELPQDWNALYDAKRKEFLDHVQRKDLGQSPMLERLISLPAVALAHYLALRAKQYEIFVDPRGQVEDENLADAIGDYTMSVVRLIREQGQTNLVSVKVDVRSEQSPGLQIADLLAGELRWWFVSNPEFLKYRSGRILLDKNELTSFYASKTATRTLIKPERRTKIPESLRRKLYVADKRSLFPYFHGSLANGLMSCIARTGEFRHIDLTHGEIIDSPDNR